LCATGGVDRSVLLGDDGVGPYVTRLLAALYEFEEGVEVEDLGTPALDLVDRISGLVGVISHLAACRRFDSNLFFR